MRDIAALLAEHGLGSDVIGLFDFIHAGIEQRELSKFEFTRNVSDAIAAIGELGQVHGFSRDDMSFVSIDTIYELYAGSSDPRQAPAILFNYLQTEADRAEMRAAVRLTREILAQSAFGHGVPGTNVACPPFRVKTFKPAELPESEIRARPRARGPPGTLRSRAPPARSCARSSRWDRRLIPANPARCESGRCSSNPAQHARPGNPASDT